jgi:hypothetical protein
MNIITKTGIALAAAPFAISTQPFAQVTSTSNSIIVGDYLGSSNALDVIFKVGGTGYGRLKTNGALQTENSTTGSGTTSATIDYQTTASGTHSAAFNYQRTASGALSFVANGATEAKAYEQRAFGRYNFVTESSTTWVATYPLFQIGNGTGTCILGLNAFELLIDKSTPARQELCDRTVPPRSHDIGDRMALWEHVDYPVITALYSNGSKARR